MVPIGAFNLCSATAYADDTDPEIQKKDRYKRLPNIQRDRPPAESLAMFEEMRSGTALSKRHCIRARITFDNSNGAMRDPIIYRFPTWESEPRPHHRTGWTWNIYPTYDFACPLVDSIKGANFTMLQLEFYPEGNAGKTEKKIHWLAFQGEEFIGAELWDFDYLLSKDSLANEDDLDKYLNPVTATMTDAWVGSAFNELIEGDIIQLERKGYFRVDKGIVQGPGGKAVLFKIPNGASK
ncbi:hypothetical protein MHUMG1_05443 [Metarhizium humberi]|uniref:Glutamyl/glutaminyl-tRNA synthetase class Ib anti-codon binding domain-containing protein n=1 Tax=Metarhizium humberi TaxID=2596975 RepID=A0A9P8MAZ4_9HYPO|nr:hypothetical protein MHUMG1_05443 [Metarhizium humberi]